MTSRQDIKIILRENRPKLTDSSIVTYGSIISNLFKRIVPFTEFNGSLFNDPKRVLDFLSETPSNTRKTILSALVVYTLQNHNVSLQYRNVMMEDGNKSNHIDMEQKMTDTQRTNWVTQKQVKEIYEKLDKETKPLFSLKSMTIPHIEKIQDFVILSLYTLIPPRRLVDYIQFKVRNFEDDDNHMTKNSFIFHTYKTSKIYGPQTVKIPIKLKNIITKYMALTTNDYLLFNPRTNEKLTNVQLNNRIGKIFGKKVSVNILRHSFLTEQYKDMQPLLEMEQRANDMGQSITQALKYVKKE